MLQISSSVMDPQIYKPSTCVTDHTILMVPTAHHETEVYIAGAANLPSDVVCCARQGFDEARATVRWLLHVVLAERSSDTPQ